MKREFRLHCVDCVHYNDIDDICERNSIKQPEYEECPLTKYEIQILHNREFN